MNGKLVLIRHGESEWNAKGWWTGWTDIALSDKGRMEARRAADALKSMTIDAVYTSNLSRAIETLEIIKKELSIDTIPTIADSALNERNYGDYTGKSKWDIKNQVGDATFLKIRRGWDTAIANGETLKDVYNRVVPYYRKNIEPLVRKGKNILISAHGNSIRALIKYLENITDTGIETVELKTGEVFVYEIDSSGKLIGKEETATNTNGGRQ